MAILKHTTGIDRRSFLVGSGIVGGATVAGAIWSDGAAASDLEDLSRLVVATDRSSTAQFRSILGAAAKAEGIALNLDQIVVASKYSYLVVAAPALGIERIDPIELKNGITQGMIYFSSSTLPQPRGLYVVRALAVQDVQLGEQPVLMQLLRGGVVLAEQRGMAHVSSLTVPPRSSGVQAEIGVGFDLVMNDGFVRANCWTCPNGVRICVEQPLCGPDGLLPSGSCG